MISPEEIVQLYHARRKTLAPRLARMNELRQAYCGELEIPLPELDRTERPMVANLIAQGLDGTAQRISTTLPNVTCPPTRAGFDNSEQRAEQRRNVIYGWWTMNKLSKIQRRRARWLVGYSSAPVIIRPDPVRSIPKWQERNPLTALPPPGDDLDPPNMIFSFRKSLAWLRAIYPESIAGLDLGKPSNEVSPDTEFTVVEYADYDCIAQIVLGAAPDQSTSSSYAQPMGVPRPGRPWAEIEWHPNLAGICPVVNPTRISLDDPVGQFDGLIGLYWWQSKLMALGGIAAQRDVFPDEWLEERANEVGAIEVEADGQQGIRGLVKGGQIRSTHAPPGQQTMGMINVMERNMRLSGGIPAEMTGESPTNIRTARRGAQVLSSAIDFTIQEAQEIFEASLEEENVRAIAIDKAYFGAQTKSFYFSWNNTKGRGSYVPNDTFETDENQVRYSFPGADINELIVGGGQRLGMKTMSNHRFMELDPLIEDPEFEHQRIISEGLEQGTLQSLLQGIASSQIPPSDAARISQLVLEKQKPLWEAIQIAQKEAQQRQATTGPPGSPEAPVAPGSPEAQPGLAAPGAGAEAGTIQPPGQSSLNLQQLRQNLLRTSA
jgi:hypothetical protein